MTVERLRADAMGTGPAPVDAAGPHFAELATALASLRGQADAVWSWGADLAERLAGGGRVLVAGNGGSAAQALHLTSELVGRFRADRPPLAAVALVADVATLTALANDDGVEELFARQIRAHGRPGDIALLLSTSGRSPDIVHAAEVAREMGLEVWAMCGAVPSRLSEAATRVLGIAGPTTAAVQEAHQVAIHLLCRSVDATFEAAPGVAVGARGRPA